MGVCYLLEYYYVFIKESQSVWQLFLKIEFSKLVRLTPEFQTRGTYKRISFFTLS